MNGIIQIFQNHSELAIFLALGLGFWMGKVKIGQVELGPVTGSLVAGILVGQMNIVVDPNIRSFFFLMFLFSVGYEVGPQFIRGLKHDGMAQLLFSILQCTFTLIVSYVVARTLGYDVGQSAGMYAGSQTVTGALGVAADSIRSLGITAEEKEILISNIPVAYTVTYLFGTVGSAWFLSHVGPKILGINLAAECKKIETQLQKGEAESALFSLTERINMRAYRVDNDRFMGKSIAEVEASFGETRVFIERLRRDGQIVDPEFSMTLKRGDIVAVIARTEIHVHGNIGFGPEVDDRPLLEVSIEIVDVVITNKSVAGRTIKEFAQSDLVRQKARGVFVRRISRAGNEIPVSFNVVIDRGDVFQLMGLKKNIDRIAEAIGYPDRSTLSTDMVSVCLAIVLGGTVGALTIHLGKMPFQLSTSVGALLAGLGLGWLRSVKRTFGRIPPSALWILRNLGLTAFIAVLGINVSSSFFTGLKQMGLTLFVAGIFVTTIPLLFGILMGKYVFKFHPGVTLGATAGAQTSAASLAMIQGVAESKVPTLGYSVPYAIGNVLLTLWGAVLVLLLS